MGGVRNNEDKEVEDVPISAAAGSDLCDNQRTCLEVLIADSASHCEPETAVLFPEPYLHNLGANAHHRLGG